MNIRKKTYFKLTSGKLGRIISTDVFNGTDNINSIIYKSTKILQFNSIFVVLCKYSN